MSQARITKKFRSKKEIERETRHTLKLTQEEKNTKIIALLETAVDMITRDKDLILAKKQVKFFIQAATAYGFESTDPQLLESLMVNKNLKKLDITEPDEEQYFPKIGQMPL